MWTRDNLDVLRGLNSDTIDLVYADPPFNSNKNYAAPVGSKAAGAAFKDSWTLSDVDVAWHGEIAEREPSVYAAIQAAGVVHGKGMRSYLTMMAVRLLELRRVLKPTGSLYLHCDNTADAYLRLLCDGVFSHTSFRNEITWARTSAHNTADRYGNVADTILFYAADERPTWNGGFHTYADREKYSEEQLRRFKHVDLTAPRANSDSGKFTWRGSTPGPGRGWGYRLEKLEQWWSQGRIRTKRDGTPRLDGLKVFLADAPGKRLQNIWTDVPRIPNTSAERTGYPTQKPLALLDRIIKASSNEGDIVLDPFCGCATACVSAESLGRQWIGIDLSPVAATLVESRLRDQFGVFAEVRHRTDVPRRTDLGKLPNYRTHAHTLFGQQEGQCAGCRIAFRFRNFEVDHVIPRAKDTDGNYLAVCLPRGAAENRPRLGAGGNFISITVLRADPTTSRTCNCSAGPVTAQRTSGRKPS